LFKVDVAGPHDGSGIGILDQGQQQMLERGIFMVPLVGKGQRLMDRFF
jgi:hypothetical protein